jgi:hypothetical protein
MAGMRVVIRAAVVAAVAVFGFAACVPEVLASPAPPHVRAIPSISVLPTVTLTVSPSFSLDQTSVDFGEVLGGTTKTVYVILKNSGAAAYNPQYVGGTPTSSDFKVSFNDCTYDPDFPAGWTCRIVYTFTPTSIGTVNASSAFTITYVDVGPVLPRFRVTLTGCGVNPGAGCPEPPPAPSADATPTARPTATRRPGSGTGPAAPPTGDAVAVDGPPGSAAPASTSAVLTAAGNATSSPSLALLAMALALAAIIGGAIVALLIWRGPRIWAMFTSRRP